MTHLLNPAFYRKRSMGILFLLSVIAIYFFLYLPIVIMVIFSFNSAPFPAAWQNFTIGWYQELFYSSELWQTLKNSLVVSGTATGLTIIFTVGFIFYQLCSGVLPGLPNKWVGLFYGNLIIPEVVLAVGLLSFFSFFGIPLSLTSLIIAHTVLGLGYAIPLAYAQFQALDRRLIEASLDLGASLPITFFRVILPLLVPSLLAAVLLVFIISFDDFIIAFFCSGSEAQTLSLYIFTSIRSGVSPVVSALASFLLLFSSLLVFIFCSLKLRTQLF